MDSEKGDERFLVSLSDASERDATSLPTNLAPAPPPFRLSLQPLSGRYGWGYPNPNARRLGEPEACLNESIWHKYLSLDLKCKA
jgi:hypothetical protein